jgi:hypothetical protein
MLAKEGTPESKNEKKGGADMNLVIVYAVCVVIDHFMMIL